MMKMKTFLYEVIKLVEANKLRCEGSMDNRELHTMRQLEEAANYMISSDIFDTARDSIFYTREQCYDSGICQLDAINANYPTDAECEDYQLAEREQQTIEALTEALEYIL